MKDYTERVERDEVLYAFHQAFTTPSADEIAAWTRRYPQFADDIRAHAAVAWDWASEEGQEVEELEENLLARGYSQALNIMYHAEHSVVETHAASATPKTFQEMLDATGKDIPGLARELKIGRSVVADLFNGWMLAPASGRLVDGITKVFAISRDAFDEALAHALQKPYLGHAKADSAPVVKPRSCADIIRESSMSEESKRFWLGEDS